MLILTIAKLKICFLIALVKVYVSLIPTVEKNRKCFFLRIFTGNNPDEISVWRSNAALPRNFFRKFYFDLKTPKMILKQGYLSIRNCHLPKKGFFTVLGALFCFSGCCPMILDYFLIRAGEIAESLRNKTDEDVIIACAKILHEECNSYKFDIDNSYSDANDINISSITIVSWLLSLSDLLLSM